MYRSRARSLSVVRVTHVRPVRLIRCLLRILTLSTRTIILGRSTSVPIIEIPYLSRGFCQRFLATVLRYVIRGIRCRILRIRLIRVRH